ncbi:helix-turn-helix domain-containing protein [Clostridium beijerinckii]|uniref:helix-turn-helix domain-containing protein n=1 Tax=Clostridium beijerinckii TaxID=1520 RepID=UPI001361B33C|nr:helix-turn-helix transcriptional regulator [Clostridium beijerinckii]MZK53325.1 helix-turn-helix domain-containing protein [Clostridium beijerinckii]MZK61430.1 helix-turn-helix domain-containing protein [Clostridium beijerinckii]MZK71672.1 helix-turn-helix domain-containing protein [Clostridium beijerinckii]MZK77065.1 helix-turn-helix domain-containing protein [Clostridium beijerinckii]MZK86720.1 helix-turn-helix domain-containing protein [Clostridium beijerinckii]
MFGDILKELRENQSMTQNDLAELLNVSRQSVGGYENNTTEPPTDIVVKIADIFNVTCDFLLGRTNEKYSLNLLSIEDNELLSKFYEDRDILLKLYENKDMLLKLYEVVDCYTTKK